LSREQRLHAIPRQAIDKLLIAFLLAIYRERASESQQAILDKKKIRKNTQIIRSKASVTWTVTPISSIAMRHAQPPDEPGDMYSVAAVWIEPVISRCNRTHKTNKTTKTKQQNEMNNQQWQARYAKRKRRGEEEWGGAGEETAQELGCECNNNSSNNNNKNENENEKNNNEDK
jgi:hypothetical protein